MSGGFLVLLQPTADYHCAPDIWLVHGIDNEPRRQKFMAHFENARTLIRKIQPETWRLDDVQRVLQKRWDITVLPNAVAITY